MQETEQSPQEPPAPADRPEDGEIAHREQETEPEVGDVAEGLRSLPVARQSGAQQERQVDPGQPELARAAQQDRKSTRLNSSHTVISYAVFCLKKKNCSITLPTASSS